ncbi:hypothetical protein APHAL10511_003679 [Amanita phalloides]|nr:hypothetical protein APHAL10511_003679 [Amanita phalloides]
MQENEERMKQGKRPRKGGRKNNVPDPTGLMQQREAPLGLDKNLGKTMVVQNLSSKGPGQPGFYCETCSRNYRDTTAYLDHINSRAHLRAIGQTTKIERSTTEQVQERIAFLREKTRAASAAKAFDFDKRLAEIRAKETALREQKKAEQKAAKDKARLEMMQDDNSEMAQLMGFGGFGSTKK